jgi:hypothetical protein
MIRRGVRDVGIAGDGNVPLSDLVVSGRRFRCSNSSWVKCSGCT